MADVVLDASALLAFLQAEPGTDEVQAALPGAAISAVNLSEVVSKLIDGGMPAEAAGRAVTGLGLAVRAFDRAAALDAAGLRASTRKAGLSLGDRACLALASSLSVPALTADHAWVETSTGVQVRVIGGRSRSGRSRS